MSKVKVTAQEALDFHCLDGKPGKISITPTKPLLTGRHLALAYSPGVAEPCLRIKEDPSAIYSYTSKGNMVAVISNGTAVLGLGNLGAGASKPVMEGKAVLFKRFADIDSIDIEVDTENPEEFINCVKLLGYSWGGINLEDIKAPECFIIEKQLREIMDIPVFHDDQHGTAIIAVAGMINAADLSGKSFTDMKVVMSGAGAAGIACLELLKAMGLPHENAILCDSAGIIYKGRVEGMNQWKLAHAVETTKRTLAEAMVGADVFIGLSVKGTVTSEMVASMAPSPIIFAMANPDPEVTPEEVKKIRADAIIATGRSDYPNQVNNVMVFPYIFRGALDVQASSINEEMKIAAAHALARLAREPVPDEVSVAYAGRKMKYGSNYIIPTPFDPRLIVRISSAVAQAAMESGVAHRPLANIRLYEKSLGARLNPTAHSMNGIFESIQLYPKRIVFAEGEEERTIRAAMHMQQNGYGIPILIGKEEKVRKTMEKIGFGHVDIMIMNAALSKKNEMYIDHLYKKLQRKGFLQRDISRMVKNDRNIFSTCMLACGDADVLITGLTRSYTACYESIVEVIDPKPNQRVIGISMMVANGRAIFIADASIHELPSAEELADIAVQTAEKARQMGHEPRVAFLSFSTFGNPMRASANHIREAVALLDKRKADFEYDGELAADVALNPDLMQLFPFCRLTGPANILIMPGLHSAHISSSLMQSLGGMVTIGPILTGLEQSVQIVQMGATVSEIVNLAAIGSMDVIHENQEKKGQVDG